MGTVPAVVLLLALVLPMMVRILTGAGTAVFLPMKVPVPTGVVTAVVLPLAVVLLAMTNLQWLELSSNPQPQNHWFLPLPEKKTKIYKRAIFDLS